jgi:hypothetical protein
MLPSVPPSVSIIRTAKPPGGGLDGVGFVADAGGAGGPRRVIEVGAGPGGAEAAVRGDEGAGGGGGGDELGDGLVDVDAVGDVGDLLGVVVLGEDGDAPGCDEAHVAACAGEVEIGMEGGAQGDAVLAIGEDGQVAAGGDDRAGGEVPLAQVRGVVGEGVAAEVDIGRAGVVELDPVGVVAVLVEQAIVVQREELADDRGGSQEVARLEGFDQAIEAGTGTFGAFVLTGVSHRRPASIS